jgi:hypothetical protein
MAEAVTITMSVEETRQVLYALEGRLNHMRSDSRHDEDRAVCERMAIMLRAHLQVARQQSRR